MGIRYYAYAFDANQSEQARRDPRSLISSDPLADAWGLEPHAAVSYTMFEQSVPERDMLYLDKAWGGLQVITGPQGRGLLARPAYAMFEGEVTMHCSGWDPWVRALLPEELPAIERDLRDLSDTEVSRILREDPSCTEACDDAYVLPHLRRAHEFVAGLVSDGRGMVYMIG